MTIRRVMPTDFDQWNQLWDGYNDFYERTVAPEITLITWARFFDSYEPVHALVAEEAGQIVGLVHYLFHRSTSMIEPSCYLQDLFVIESARGRGIGRALMEAVYEKAKEANSPRVYLLTHLSNENAMQLYDKVAEKSGFIMYRKQL